MDEATDPRRPTAEGLHLDGAAVGHAFAEAPDWRGLCRVTALPIDRMAGLPPAAILPRLLGEPLRVDTELPGHVRGTGLEWPPDAWVDPDHGSGRFPCAYAWAMLSSESDAEWTWQPADGTTDRRAATAAAALAATIAAKLRGRASEAGGAKPVVVIPNDLDPSGQDDLLDAARARGDDVRLLWRPVAAAIQWIDRYHGALEARASRDASAGKVLALHLGVDGFECDVLDLVAAKASGVARYVPARRRPMFPASPWLGVAIAELIGHVCLSRAGPARLQDLWRLNWASPFPLWSLAILLGQTDEETAVRHAGGIGLDPSVVRCIRPYWDRMSSSLDLLAESLALARPGALREFRATRVSPCRPPDIVEWMKSLAKLLGPVAGDVTGCVVTGALAALPVQGTTLALAVLRRILPRVPSETLVEGTEDADSRLLPRGAAVYAARLAAGMVGYYDTLPDLRVLTLKMGRPSWSHLLAEDDRFVEGGKPFVPIDREGYFLRANETAVVLRVVLGGQTVRKVESRLPRRAKVKQDIRLRVSIEPAQGNARVRIVPTDPAFLEGHPPIYLDWKTAEDTKLTPQQVIETLPRNCPETEPRRDSRALWGKMAGKFRARTEALRASHSPREIHEILRQAKTDLQRWDDRLRRDIGIHARAVSSDGTVEVQQQVLDRFLEAIVKLIPRPDASRGLALRVLAYASCGHEELERFLVSRIGWKTLTEDHNAGLLACGECLRDPHGISLFADELKDKLSGSAPAGQGCNEWLKALAKILMYRERACELLTSPLCVRLTQLLLRVFTALLDARNGGYVFRHSALCIVFLLRRRIFDDDYLAPNSDLAESVKTAFRDAIRESRRGRLNLIGGTVDLPAVLQRLIDYIDEKGHGTISEGLFEAGDGDAE